MYRVFPHLSLLVFLLIPCYIRSNCVYDSDCGNNTLCCRRRTLKTLCKVSCSGESCFFDWDCGSNVPKVCCRDKICRDSTSECLNDKSSKWIIIAIATGVCVPSVIGAIITVLIVLQKRKRLRNKSKTEKNESKCLLGNQERESYS